MSWWQIAAAVGSQVIGGLSAKRKRKRAKRFLRKAGESEAQARQREQRLSQIQNIRARRQATARARVEAARIKNQAAARGAGGSSSVTGSVGGIRSGIAGSIGFQERVTRLNELRLSSLNRAARFRTKAGGQQQGARESLAFGQLGASFASFIPSGGGSKGDNT